jgi:putative FmdB family regulatory protein
MPLYPFACEACGAEFEELVTRISAEVVAECPSCGSVGPPCGATGCRRISPT